MLSTLVFHMAVERGSLTGCAVAAALSVVLHIRFFCRSVVDVRRARARGTPRAAGRV